jgi:NhaP-type Na+/H+ and K+/H+ antiporter
MHIELLLLIFSALFFASILAEKAGSRFGMPALLLFLAVGMFFGDDGLGVHFDNRNSPHDWYSGPLYYSFFGWFGHQGG